MDASTSKVGIKTETPTSELSVDGTIDFTNLSGSVSYAENLDIDTGTETVFSFNVNSHNAAFFDYYIKNGVNFRAGTVTVISNGTTTQFTDVSTVSIGDTTSETFSETTSSPNVTISLTTDSDNVIVKGILRLV